MGETIDGDYYLTVLEVARRVGVSQESIRRWIRLGHLRSKKVGTQYFILEQDVDELEKGK